MEVLLLFYGIIMLGAFGMLIYMKIDNKRRKNNLPKIISGEKLMFTVLVIILAAAALICSFLDVEPRFVNILNSIAILLLLVLSFGND